MGKRESNQSLFMTKLTKVDLEKIIDSIDEAIVGCDREGFINIYNTANEKREKLNRRQVINQHVSKVYDFHGGLSLLMQAIEKGEPILDTYQEYTVVHSNTYVEIICSTVPIVEEGVVIGAVSVMKDYSKVKKLSKIIIDLQSNLYRQREAKKGKKTSSPHRSFEEIIGESQHLKETLKWAKKAANNSLPVLIFGETGTGKELLAQGIHSASSRGNRPCIAINCAAIPENLLEGILFGTTKGAFTGAIDRPGLFEQASGSSLILDEVNSMSAALQIKLLRVIQEEAVMRVGDVKERAINTRVISISNEDPLVAVKKKSIRSDLYYRIAYITMGLPPLRKRIDDLPLLTDFLIKKYNKKLGLTAQRLTDELSQALESYHWPGNIRELEHVIASGMSSLMVGDEVIEPSHLPPNSRGKLMAPRQAKEVMRKRRNLILAEILEKVEEKTILKALEKNQWNISKTARELGLKRQSLQYRIKKYSLQR